MRTLVVGAGVSGTAAARLLRSLGDDVVVYDRQPEALAIPAGEGFPTAAGAWYTELLDRVDRVVVSPGVPERADPIRDAIVRGVRVLSEIELAAGRISAPIVAVTGTNGKTTVTRLVHEMLVDSGVKAALAGNIGTALSEVALAEWDAVVVEVSSFQLRFTDRFHPRVAVWLNLAPDHLDWHGSFEAYAEAKARIFRNQGPADALIYDIDGGVADWIQAAAASRYPVRGTEGAEGKAGPRDGRLEFPGGTAGLPAGLDAAFTVDLAAAATAAALIGADPGSIAGVVESFEPGPHRRQRVAERGGVAWVNDSKATNPHAAGASVAAYDSVVLIAGGLPKGLDLTPVVTHPAVKGVIALGAATDAIVAARPDARPASSMKEAVEIATTLATAGDTVLLAPACASFDMFDSYAARGDAFVEAIAELEGSVA